MSIGPELLEVIRDVVAEGVALDKVELTKGGTQ
jgi:hypothetical protein